MNKDKLNLLEEAKAIYANFDMGQYYKWCHKVAELIGQDFETSRAYELLQKKEIAEELKEISQESGDRDFFFNSFPEAMK